MAIALARRAGITPDIMTDEEICYEANRFEMRGGGLSWPYCPAVCELPAHDQIRILTEYEALVWRHVGAFLFNRKRLQTPVKQKALRPKMHTSR